MAAARARADPASLAERACEIGYRAALGILGDRQAAEDVAQELAVRALLHGRKLRDPARADAWLRRVAIRLAFKEIKRAATRRAAEHDATVQRGVVADASAAWISGLLELLEGLPPRQRAALTLRYAFDLSDQDIAAALGCRQATVRVHLHQGRAAMRTRVTEHGDTTHEP